MQISVSLLAKPQTISRSRHYTYLRVLECNGATHGTCQWSGHDARQGPEGELTDPHALIQQHCCSSTPQAQGTELQEAGRRERWGYFGPEMKGDGTTCGPVGRQGWGLRC
jgi:hypothetical protein